MEELDRSNILTVEDVGKWLDEIDTDNIMDSRDMESLGERLLDWWQERERG